MKYAVILLALALGACHGNPNASSEPDAIDMMIVGGMMNRGPIFQPAPQPIYRAPVTTDCQRFGNQVNCYSY